MNEVVRATADPELAVYFDGRTSAKHLVTLEVSSTLEMYEDGEFLAAWAYGDIRRADGPPGVLRLRNVAGAPLARLEIRESSTRAAVEVQCTLLEGETERPRTKIIAWSLGAAATIGVLVWFGIPLLADAATPLLPVAIEEHLGKAAESEVSATFGEKTCATPAGTAALRKLVGTLQSEAHLPLPPDPVVLASTIPNAVVLPGGKIFVLRGLLDKAREPDELAGVLAHEMGHSAHRDGLRGIIKQNGTALLIGLVLGQAPGASVFGGLVTAAYSREAEAAADFYAAEVMTRLGRSPKGLGDLLTRIEGNESKGKLDPLAIFATHPMTSERRAALAGTADQPHGAPLLTDREWASLKAICE